jgi:hypothetical protein
MLGVEQVIPDEPIYIEFRGECGASVDNDGPKSGVLWGISVVVREVPSLWKANVPPSLGREMTVEGKSGSAFAQPITLSCDQVLVEEAYRDLCSDSKALVVDLTYDRHGFLSRKVKRHARLKVPKESLQVAFREWAAQHGRNL